MFTSEGWVLAFSHLEPGIPSWAQQYQQAPSHQDRTMTTPFLQRKCDCGKQSLFSGAFTRICCEGGWLLLGQGLCNGSCSPYAGENTWGGVWKPSCAGTGGIREEIICAAFLWVPGELICGMLRHLLCTFASTDASGQHRLSLHNSVGIAHTQSMTGFGKKDFCSCIIIRSFCHVTDFGLLIILKKGRTS